MIKKCVFHFLLKSILFLFILPHWQPSIKMICRYARVLSGNKPFRHYTVVTEGSPGTFSALLQLSAFLSGYTFLQLRKCIPNQSRDEQISFFKNQFIGLCMKAGMKVRISTFVFAILVLVISLTTRLSNFKSKFFIIYYFKYGISHKNDFKRPHILAYTLFLIPRCLVPDRK